MALKIVDSAAVVLEERLEKSCCVGKKKKKITEQKRKKEASTGPVVNEKTRLLNKKSGIVVGGQVWDLNNARVGDGL